jgi:membrane protein YqaA with SNARE-associated domain
MFIILLVLGVILFIIFSDPNMVSFFESLTTIMYDFVVNNPVSAYLGAFVISTFGHFTIFLPVPYALAVFLVGAQPYIEPILLAVICGIGAGIGEIVAYLIGYGGRKFIEKKYEKNLNSVKAIIERYGFWAILLFAATPLPDDTLLIPLGVLRYNLLKAFLACTLGKILLCGILAYGGKFGWGFVELIFTGGGAIGTVIGIIGTVILLYVILKIDWSKILGAKKVDAHEVKKDLNHEASGQEPSENNSISGEKNNN